jgi:predicted regulator of Ras-like GTPase activity (Roadblock/LC7/MglB family)
MSLDNVLQKVVTEVPECVASGYVDLSSGMLLGAKTVDSHPSEVLEVVAAATADLFQGSNVVTIEKMFKKARGVKDDGHHYFQEIMVNSDNLIHVFLRGKSNEEQVLTVVCRKSANLGMVLSKTRTLLSEVEKAA